MNKKHYLLKDGIIFMGIATPFIFWFATHINTDFWYDEVSSLYFYVFRGVNSIVTNYRLPNNHIFFNLINHFYLKMLGITSLYSLMDFPYKIRCLSLFYSLVTFFYVYLIGKNFFNKYVAYLFLIIFTTTIPYFNFALQVRGYNMSIMLISIIIYHCMRFEEKNKTIDGLFFLIGIILCLYTIPLNLYFILSMGVFYFIDGILKYIRNKTAYTKSVPMGKGTEHNPSRFPRILFLKNSSLTITVDTPFKSGELS